MKSILDSIELLDSFIELSSELICSISPDGRFNKLNHIWEKVLGYSLDELLGHSLADFVHPEDIESSLIQLNNHDSEQTGVYFVNRCRCKDGTYKWLSWNSLSLKGNKDFCAVVHDITSIQPHNMKESEERYRQLFESRTDAVFMVDIQTGSFLDANLAASELYGYSKDEFLAMNTQDVTAEPEKTEQAIANGVKIIPVRYHRKKSGQIFPVSISARYFELSGKKVHVAVVHDLTDKHQTEAQLSQSQDHLQLALKSSRMGTYEWDIVNDKRVYDEYGYKILGIDPKTFQGTTKAFLSLLHPEDRSIIEKTLTKPIEERADYQREYRVLRLDGGVYYIASRGKVYMDRQGKPNFVRGVFWDITEQKKTEMARKEFEQKYRKLYDSMVDGFVIMGMDGKFQECNNALCLMLGFSKEEFLGMSYREIMWDAINQTIFSKQLLVKGYSDTFEKEIVRKDGKILQVELRFHLMDDAQGRHSGVWSIIKDISVRKNVEKRELEYKRALEESQRNLKKFSQQILAVREEEKKKLSLNLHDEIGAMAVALSAGLSVIQSDLKKSNYKDALKDIRHIKSILKNETALFRKIAHDLRPPNLEVIGLTGVLREYFSEMTKAGRLSIKFSYKENKETILSDQIATALYRVTQEALTNIIKHAQAKKVLVNLKYAKSRIIYTIIDDGRGFDLKEASNNSEEFKLGIKGMQERIDALGGTFVLKTSSKKGTSISIAVPYCGNP